MPYPGWVAYAAPNTITAVPVTFVRPMQMARRMLRQFSWNTCTTGAFTTSPRPPSSLPAARLHPPGVRLLFPERRCLVDASADDEPGDHHQRAQEEGDSPTPRDE